MGVVGDLTREANELVLVEAAESQSSTSLLVGVSSPLEEGDWGDGGLSRLALVVLLLMLMGLNPPVDILAS